MNRVALSHYLKTRYDRFLNNYYLFSKFTTIFVFGIVFGFIYELPIVIALLLGWIAASILPPILNLYYTGNGQQFRTYLTIFSISNSVPKLTIQEYDCNTRFAFYATYVGHYLSLTLEPAFIVSHYLIAAALTPVIVTKSLIDYLSQDELNLFRPKTSFSESCDLTIQQIEEEQEKAIKQFYQDPLKQESQEIILCQQKHSPINP